MRGLTVNPSFKATFPCFCVFVCLGFKGTSLGFMYQTLLKMMALLSPHVGLFFPALTQTPSPVYNLAYCKNQPPFPLNSVARGTSRFLPPRPHTSAEDPVSKKFCQTRSFLPDSKGSKPDFFKLFPLFLPTPLFSLSTLSVYFFSFCCLSPPLQGTPSLGTVDEDWVGDTAIEPVPLRSPG